MERMENERRGQENCVEIVLSDIQEKETLEGAHADKESDQKNAGVYRREDKPEKDILIKFPEFTVLTSPKIRSNGCEDMSRDEELRELEPRRPEIGILRKKKECGRNEKEKISPPVFAPFSEETDRYEGRYQEKSDEERFREEVRVSSRIPIKKFCESSGQEARNYHEGKPFYGFPGVMKNEVWFKRDEDFQGREL